MLHALKKMDEPSVPDEVMRAMFAARKAVFVDLLKWDVPVLAGLYELDQFDDENARYLILADRDHRHLGSVRLLPTARPHILDSFFSDLCEGPPPRGPDIFEVTRFCLDRSLNAADRRMVRDTLIVSLADHALAQDIVAYTAIAELRWLRQILAFGWRCRPLGPPARCGEETLGALRIDVDADTPRLLAEAGITPTRSLVDGDLRTAA